MLAVVGVALEHHARGTTPVGKPEGIGADRVLHDPVGIGLDDLARQRATHVAADQVVQKAGIRLAEADPIGVAVQRAQRLDLTVVVEPAVLLGGRPQGLHARHLLVEQVQIGRLDLRVPVTLQRVDMVRRGQLALAALEGRVVGKVDARPYADRPRAPVVGDFGHAGGGVRDHLARPGEEVVGQRCIEDVRQDDARVQVVDLAGIEACLSNLKGVAQHLVLRRSRYGCEQAGEQRGEEAKHHRDTTSIGVGNRIYYRPAACAAASMSMNFHQPRRNGCRM